MADQRKLENGLWSLVNITWHHVAVIEFTVSMKLWQRLTVTTDHIVLYQRLTKSLVVKKRSMISVILRFYSFGRITLFYKFTSKIMILWFLAKNAISNFKILRFWVIIHDFMTFNFIHMNFINLLRWIIQLTHQYAC